MKAKLNKDNSAVSFELMFKLCKSGPCPAIYECTNGDFIVQGYSLSDLNKKDMQMSDNENAVMIPKDLFVGFINKREG